MLSSGFVLLLVLLLVVTYMVVGCRRGLSASGRVAGGAVVYIDIEEAPGALLAPSSFHPLSTNGPFLDLHFGPLNEDTPVGVTYYVRPLTRYTPPCKRRLFAGCGCGGKGAGSVVFAVAAEQRLVCFNTNSVSDAVTVEGQIVLSPFEWKDDGSTSAPPAVDQRVSASLKVSNRTGLVLQGLHVHDGQRSPAGLTGFGKIVYFLYSSRAWSERYNATPQSLAWAKAHCPLPADNVVPARPDFLMQISSPQS